MRSKNERISELWIIAIILGFFAIGLGLLSGTTIFIINLFRDDKIKRFHKLINWLFISGSLLLTLSFGRCFLGPPRFIHVPDFLSALKMRIKKTNPLRDWSFEE